MHAPHRVRVKFCGITRAVDARAAAAAGADAIGLVFVPGSTRCVTPAQAAAIVAALPPLVTRVGVFVDAEAAAIEAALAQVALDVLQFHGDEPPADCTRWGRPYIKAVRMGAGEDLAARAREHTGAAALLVDTWDPRRAGGTGRAFDWSRLPGVHPAPLVLAGGLTPDNVAGAIARTRPFAVDVSGGIESREGVKDPEKMRRFMHAVECAGG